MRKTLTVNVGLNAKRETNSGHVRSEIIESIERLNIDKTREWRLANAPKSDVWPDSGTLVVEVETLYNETHIMRHLVNLCDHFEEEAIAYTIADEEGEVYCKNIAYRSDYTKRYLFSDNLFVKL
tara:strand:- start:289 stop:660 length:372 start_codon:yes stop_codon:yes gene_type:complete